MCDVRVPQAYRFHRMNAVDRIKGQIWGRTGQKGNGGMGEGVCGCVCALVRACMCVCVYLCRVGGPAAHAV